MARDDGPIPGVRRQKKPAAMRDNNISESGGINTWNGEIVTETSDKESPEEIEGEAQKKGKSTAI